MKHNNWIWALGILVVVVVYSQLDESFTAVPLVMGDLSNIDASSLLGNEECSSILISVGDAEAGCCPLETLWGQYSLEGFNQGIYCEDDSCYEFTKQAPAYIYVQVEGCDLSSSYVVLIPKEGVKQKVFLPELKDGFDRRLFISSRGETYYDWELKQGACTVEGGCAG